MDVPGYPDPSTVVPAYQVVTTSQEIGRAVQGWERGTSTPERHLSMVFHHLSQSVPGLPWAGLWPKEQGSREAAGREISSGLEWALSGRGTVPPHQLKSFVMSRAG